MPKHTHAHGCVGMNTDLMIEILLYLHTVWYNAQFEYAKNALHVKNP